MWSIINLIIFVIGLVIIWWAYENVKGTTENYGDILYLLIGVAVIIIAVVSQIVKSFF
jgi:hypothetical protein